MALEDALFQLYTFKIMKVYQAFGHPNIGNPPSKMEMERKVELKCISKKIIVTSYLKFMKTVSKIYNRVAIYNRLFIQLWKNIKSFIKFLKDYINS